ncbi:hypothetical protein OROGR_014350 [Orobanche gracilis]
MNLEIVQCSNSNKHSNGSYSVYRSIYILKTYILVEDQLISNKLWHDGIHFTLLMVNETVREVGISKSKY